jgi:anti-sigma B factor antagonist
VVDSQTTLLSPEVAVYALFGRIDETNWEHFQAGMVEAARLATGGLVILDFSQAGYIGSRGLRALTTVLREVRGSGKVVIAAANELVREIFQISRYDQMFAMFDSVEAAVREGPGSLSAMEAKQLGRDSV